MKNHTYTIKNWESNIIDIVARKFEVCMAKAEQLIAAWEQSTKIDWRADYEKGIDHYEAGRLVADQVWDYAGNQLDEIFIPIALESHSEDDFITRARIIKSLPVELSQYFAFEFGREGEKELSINQATRNYLEYAISKNLEKASRGALKYYIEVLEIPLPF